MLQNRRQQDGWQYTVPATKHYPYQWLWDSCFHAIILTHFNLRAAKAELRALVSHQCRNGFVGHVTYWEKQHDVLKIDWGLPHTSSLLQPPLLALAVFRVYEKDKDKEFVEELYQPLKNFYDYIWRERRVRSSGLIGLVNPDESGEDNSPRFDEALGLPPLHEAKANTEKRHALFAKPRQCQFKTGCTSQEFWVEDAPFNTLLVWNFDLMSRLSTIVGKVKEAKDFDRRANNLKQAMREHMFKDGVYWSLSGLTGKRISAKTSSAFFFPLAAGLYSQQEAAFVVKSHLLNKDSFWLPHGVPTTAKDDPAFSADEPSWGQPWQHPHWRGPIWMSVHWFIYQGLKRYGFNREATELREKSLRLVENSGFKEYFHPLTGAGQGASNFTWGGLVIDMN